MARCTSEVGRCMMSWMLSRTRSSKVMPSACARACKALRCSSAMSSVILVMSLRFLLLLVATLSIRSFGLSVATVSAQTVAEKAQSDLGEPGARRLRLGAAGVQPLACPRARKSARPTNPCATGLLSEPTAAMHAIAAQSTATLAEIQATFARVGGQPLSEIVIEQRGPKG